MAKKTPVVTKMQVIPVAGYDSMEMTLSGAHGPFFTRNIVILDDSSGHRGIGEIHGGDYTCQCLESFIPLVEGEETFKEIALIELERNIRYCSFNNLGKIDQKHPDERMRHGLCGYSKDYSTGKNYYIYVEAEDKNGKIISKSNKEKGSVFVLENGFYSLFY